MLAVSWTYTRGAESRSYSIFFRSVWQIPQLSTRTRISPRPTEGVWIDCTATRPCPRYTAARIERGISSLGASAVDVWTDSAADKKLSQYSRGFIRAAL